MSPFARPASRPDWRPDRWGALRCLAVWDESEDVRTFLLAPDEAGRIDFDAGQFMTFRIDEGGESVERTYTLSSSAANHRSVTITVKRKAGGRVSGVLHRLLAPGERIEAFGPAGGFGPAALPAESYALLAAGSGITPMLSMVRTAADLGVRLDAVLIHAVRRSGDLIAADELAALRRRMPGLRVVGVVSAAGEDWRGERGRLDEARLRCLIPDLFRRAVLSCGPAPFMAATRDAARALGVPASRYAEESFVFDATTISASDETGPVRRVSFARSGRAFDCPAGHTILQAAKRAGIPMPSSCGRGVCGTCKCAKLSGIVAMSHGGGIRQREIDRGFILPCSSRPESDVVLDR